MRAKAGVVALALLMSSCGDADEASNMATPNAPAPLPTIAAPNNGDWTQTVSRTADGGALIGNPAAPVKLVEYGSLSCPVCGTFAQEATQSLRDTYVRSGQVSWEFRHLLVHGAPDITLAMLADCQPPTAFFRTIEQIYGQQREILDRLDPAETQRIQALPPEQQLGPLARAMELDTFFARRGMPESRFAQCLGDRGVAQRLAESTNRALTEQNITGTPAFIINGERQDVTQWAALEPRLRTALGR